MIQIKYNPWDKTVTFDDRKMPLADFQQMCLENGWEGTLFKINAVAQAAEMAIQKVFREHFERFLATCMKDI